MCSVKGSYFLKGRIHPVKSEKKNHVMIMLQKYVIVLTLIIQNQ